MKKKKGNRSARRKRARSTSTAPQAVVVGNTAIAHEPVHADEQPELEVASQASGSFLRVRPEEVEAAPHVAERVDELEPEPEPTSGKLVEERPQDDQRATPRTSLAVEIHLASDSHFFSGLSGDISEGGLFVSTYRALPVGSEVEIELTLPASDETIVARGSVRWIREHSAGLPRGVGIAFEALSEETRERIHAFCAARPPLYYDDLD